MEIILDQEVLGWIMGWKNRCNVLTDEDCLGMCMKLGYVTLMYTPCL